METSLSICTETSLFLADSSCKGRTAFLMTTLCEQYRLVPHVRSKFGGPAEGYCDICRTNVAGRRGRAIQKWADGLK